MSIPADAASDHELAHQLFAETRSRIPPADEIAGEAIVAALNEHESDEHYIKTNFSSLVSSIQIAAYERYLRAEAEAAAQALNAVVGPLLPPDASATEAFSLLGRRFAILDRYFLSMTQSRRPRAGRTFEIVVRILFEKLHYPYTFQPDLGESRPDYVLPSLEWYQSYAADCMIVTCKRTLRERWRQVVTEGATGTSFFLATIDDKLSGAELDRMKDRHVVVVVPEEVKSKRYSARVNVISFETFFAHYVDSAITRWRAQGAIS